MILETERLIIEEATQGDTSFIFKLLNSPNWLQYIGDRGINTEADALEYINESLIGSYRQNGYGLYKMVLKDGSESIGLCGFLKRDYLNYEDIGFAILPQYERKGYTFEAANAMMKYGEKELGLSQVYAITTAKNTGSQKVLEKIGLTYTKDVTIEEKESLMLFAKNQ